MFLKTIILASLTMGLTVQSVQTFSNTGTFPTGWSDFYVDGASGNAASSSTGSIAQVSNVFYDTAPAIKVTATYDPNHQGLYHAEVHRANAYSKGDTGFYGFAFRLSQDWEFTPQSSFNIAQFIADFTDLPCDETYMPSSMIWISGNQLYSRVKTGNVCPVSEQQINPFNSLATVTAGAWHKVVIQAKWRSDTTGYYKIWLDGVSVLNKTSPAIATTVTDGRPFQFRVGLYANGWKKPSEGGMKGTQPFRQIWFDKIATGTTFADVDPDQW
ncbi:uncharacterized protein RCO7_09864 [Rhynchosporium graminicola]|uniref:Polysaccharide lyase n=1 Tax=Rhynchosporium graminicola TaxID=2792576 RepID=A0A1E1LES3_9HELO|nr:uncharacterized protein RCO7_09864 [Rhynchosporium commune]